LKTNNPDLNEISTDERKKIAEDRYRQLLSQFETLPQKVKEDFKNVPSKYRRSYLEVHSAKKPSFPLAIKLKCLSCCSWDRVEISHCTVRQCGLWKLRPYQEK